MSSPHKSTTMAMQSFRQRLETKQGIGIVIALLSGGVLVYLFLTPWALRKLSDGFYLGFFNMLSMGLLLLMGLGLAADKHRKEVPEELKTLTLRGFLGVLVLAAGCLLYFEVMRRIGFLVITPIFLFIAFFALKLGHWWRCVVLAVVVTVIVYLLFSVVGLELPRGFLSVELPI